MIGRPPSASAFDRIEVSGVCRLWLTPRRKSSLTSLSWRSWRFWSWTWSNSSAFRMATPISLAYRSRRVWSARSQVRVAGQARQDQAQPLVAGPQLGADRHGDARDALLGLDASPGRRTGATAAMKPKAASASRAARSAIASTPSRGSADSTAARISPSWRLRRSASAARRLWLSASWARTSLPDDRDRLAHVAGRDARHRRRDLAQRPRRGRARPTAPPRIPTPTATANMNRRSRSPISGSTAPVAMSSTPKTPSGMIAAARRVRVSRVWKDRARPAAGGSGRRSRSSGRVGGALGGRSGLDGLAGHQPVADAADRQQVARPVRVDLELLAQAPHRHPDVGRLGVVGLRPAARQQGLGRDGLAEVGGQGEEQPRFGRGELDGLAADDRPALVELEDRGPARDRGPCAAPARRPVAGPAGSALAAPSSGRAW